MAATAIDERIAKTEKRLTQLREQRRRKEAAERAASAKRERAADTRRKILAGAVILADPGLRGLVMEALRQRLTRQDDRALFGFLDQQQGADDAASGETGQWPSQPAEQHASGDDLCNQHAAFSVQTPFDPT